VLSVLTVTRLNKVKKSTKYGKVRLDKLIIKFCERQYYYLKNVKYLLQQKFL